MTHITRFEDMNLSSSMLQSIKQKGFEEATPIQASIIPLFLSWKADIVGQAQTGTGKTAAFAIPLIELINTKDNKTQAIILTPTRELAIQVAEEINSFAVNSPVNIALVYGGQSIMNETRKLKSWAQIVVGTPGRVKDHIGRKNLRLEHIKYFVLDEADEMLNIGFRDEIEEILEATPADKRVLLFSATMPKEILVIAKTYMKDFETISIKRATVTNESINQIYFEVKDRDKFEALCRILDVEDDFFGIVFCRTKRDVDEVSDNLKRRGYLAEALHGDIDQRVRERILKKFKSNEINILVATDVAARGIDVNNLTHVINYALPENPESYTHRIGRTGRAGKTGTAINFVSKAEYRKLFLIERMTKSPIKKEKLPNMSEVSDIKKSKFVEKIKQGLEEGTKNKEYLKYAEELLAIGDSKEIIATLLEKFLPKNDNGWDGRDLNDSGFSRDRNSREFSNSGFSRDRDMSDDSVSYSLDKNMPCRLFLAKGKVDRMTSDKVREFIIAETEVDISHVKEIDIYDNFTFLNVPFKDAEIILATFKQKNKRKPLVVQAKKK